MDPIQVKMAITVAIGFAAYIFVLSKVAVKPVTNLLDERGATIKKAFDDIEHQQQELARLRKEYQERLDRMESEAEARRAAAIAEGERIAAELRAEAERRHEELLAKAKEDMEREIAKTRIAFRDQVVAAAVNAAEQVVKDQMDDQLQASLIDRYIEDLQHVNH